MATVRTEKEDVVQVDLATVPAYLANENLANDCCALRNIHEPGILYNLEQRSGMSEPYTLLGSVLVAVNPLTKIPDPEGILAVAESAVAFGQMQAAGRLVAKLNAKVWADPALADRHRAVLAKLGGAG